MSQYTYAVLGAGRQGTAAAYDLAKFGDARRIILFDIDHDTAKKSAQRINQLIGRDVAVGLELDVSNQDSVTKSIQQIKMSRVE